MSNHTQKQHDQAAGNAPPATSAPKKGSVSETSAESVNDADMEAGRDPQDIPRWRQIEIMQERAELRAALDDMDAEFDEIDQLEREVFGTESENETLYMHDDEAGLEEDVDGEQDVGPEEEVELEGDGLEDETFEDFADD